MNQLTQHTPEKIVSKPRIEEPLNAVCNDFSENCSLHVERPSVRKSNIQEFINDDGSDRIREMVELGLDTEEIFEINKRIDQELRDQKLAIQIQEELCGLTQEEIDRKIAMEAQDKG